MEISDVQPQKKRGRYNVFVDGEFWGGLSERTLAKYGLYKGKNVEPSDLSDIFRQELEWRLMERCIRKIGRRPHSIEEIRRYLKNVWYKKGKTWTEGSAFSGSLRLLYSELESDIVDELEEKGYLSDMAFADWWVDQRIRTGLKGWVAIRSELYAKGVEREVIESVRIPVDVERECAERAYTKYCKGKIADRDACIRRLQSRGFAWDIIKDIVKEEEHGN